MTQPHIDIKMTLFYDYIAYHSTIMYSYDHTYYHEAYNSRFQTFKSKRYI